MMRKSVLLVIHVLWLSFVSAQLEIPLYDNIPNSIPSVNKEESKTTDGILRISKVSIPAVTVFLPKNPTTKRSAVVICPGGGYAILAASHEGFDVAKQLSEWGIVAIVLKYRLPDGAIMKDKTIGPLQDAQRALQLTREKAAEWNIDSSKIGIMGFSAGGHLASTASTHFNTPVIDNPKGISLRPDFSILIYPVISFTDSLAHMGSRNNLIGKSAGNDMVTLYSNELQVTANTPPAFLVHAGDDKTVKVENSIRYYEALLKFKIPGELHLYPNGGHGFGMNNRTTGDKWMERLKNWLIAGGWL